MKTKLNIIQNIKYYNTINNTKLMNTENTLKTLAMP